MIFLAEFTPIQPDFGLIFWTTIVFGIFWFMMAKFSFGPIRDALKKRNSDIQTALDEAKRARDEMSNLKAENAKVMNQAREERTKILKEAKEAHATIVNEAKTKAKEEAQRIVSNAQAEIENQKLAAMAEVKNEAGRIALEIAEKIIRQKLQGDAAQESYVNNLVDEMK